jgi:hypothetical protein
MGPSVSLLWRDPPPLEQSRLYVPVSVFARFDPEWRDRVLRLPQAAEVAVIGCIQNVQRGLSGSISLEHCELVTAQPEAP